MFRSSLFLKTFSTITAGVFVMCAIFYLTTVPMIKGMAFEMEEKAGQKILNNVYLLIEQSHTALESWKKTAIAGHKRELRHLIDLVTSYINSTHQVEKKKGVSEKEIKRQILLQIRNFRYGVNQDYIWVSDYKSRLISHPDPKLNDVDFSKVRDVKGELIVPPMVNGAITHGDGYYNYWWRRLGQKDPIEKLSYYRNFSQWKWVVGTGVYIDDIQRETETRKKELLFDLKKLIHATKFAGQGYLFIFDSHMNMIIHPNPNIEETNFSKLLDPATGKPIGKELIQASKTTSGKLYYKWDKPANPGNYIYDKIAWIRYYPGFDWYIALSVYTSDLERSATALTRRIVFISLGALILAVICGYLFVRTFTTPITRMAESANRISNGDLSSTIELKREDEIGQLAKAFNNMVHQLRYQIRNLEERVKERTAELIGRVNELKNRNKEIETINAMGDLLQACRNPEEIYGIIIHTIKALFPSSSGEILSLRKSVNLLEVVAAWKDSGSSDAKGKTFKPEDCWSIRRSKPHFVSDEENVLACRHTIGISDARPPYFCIPMTAQGEIGGILHVRIPAAALALLQDDDVGKKNPMRLLETVAEHASLSLANMKLQQTLQEQSTKDPLTGLYNRRYSEEVLLREQKRTIRGKNSMGILLIDLDYFKKVNDTWGHEAGDEILRRFAGILRREFRTEDTVCRYGGEEFLIILPGTDLAQAETKAEQLRKIVQKELHITWQNQEISATISIGIARFPSGNLNIQQIIDAADKALYQAKYEGRNRIFTFREKESAAEI